MTEPISVTIAIAFLIAAAQAATARGVRLFAGLFVFTLIVVGVNTLNEAVVFEVVTRGEAARAFAVIALSSAILSAVAVLTAPRPSRGAEPPQLRITPLRLAVISVVYVVIYLAAGTLVFPLVADFYADKPLPEFGPLIGMQLVRGLIYAVGIIALLRTGVRQGPLMSGLGLAVLGGIAPLAAANPHMPFEVRIPHMIEVAASNLLFGAFAAWLLLPRSEGAKGVSPSSRRP